MRVGKGRFAAASALLMVAVCAPSASAATGPVGSDPTASAPSIQSVTKTVARLQPGPSTAASGDGTFNVADPGGDTNSSASDLVGISMSTTDSYIALRADFAVAQDPTAAPWSNPQTYLAWTIDSGGDGEDDIYAVIYAQGSSFVSVIFSRWGGVLCEPSAINTVSRLSETALELAAWPRCFQTPPSVSVSAVFRSNSTGVDGDEDYDFAPDSGYVGPVALTPGPYQPFGVYGVVADANGGIHGVGKNAGNLGDPDRVPYWPGADLGRGARFVHDDSGYQPEVGYEADAYGGVHPIATSNWELPPPVTATAYYPGWSIIRGFDLLPDNTGGYTLDAWGGLHPFALEGEEMPPEVTVGPYWPGWDIARGVAIRKDGGGGYIVDGWGGLHPFAIGDNDLPPVETVGPYWPGWDVVRGVSAVREGGGFVVDAWGGTHAYGTVDSRPPAALSKTNAPYWPGWDIVRGIGVE